MNPMWRDAYDEVAADAYWDSVVVPDTSFEEGYEAGYARPNNRIHFHCYAGPLEIKWQRGFERGVRDYDRSNRT
jgi:hypothetical protein